MSLLLTFNLTHFSSGVRAGFFKRMSKSLRAALTSLGSEVIATVNGSIFARAGAGGIRGFIMFCCGRIKSIPKIKFVLNNGSGFKAQTLTLRWHSTAHRLHDFQFRLNFWINRCWIRLCWVDVQIALKVQCFLCALNCLKFYCAFASRRSHNKPFDRAELGEKCFCRSFVV